MLAEKIDTGKLRLYAHRGASASLPENTMEAFTEGLNAGANALELDIRCTSDDQLVVIHDEDGRRLAQIDRKITNCTWEEVRKWDVSCGLKSNLIAREFKRKLYRIPRFEKVLQAFPKVVINVDIKTCEAHVPKLVLAAIKKNNAVDTTIVTSFYKNVMKRVHDLGYEGQMGFCKTDVGKLFFLPEFMLRGLKGNIAQVPISVLCLNFAQKSFINKCHNLGLKVDFWTINDPALAKSLLDLGADGIMTDDPVLLKSTIF